MEFDNKQRPDSVYSLKMKAGKRRTYFFDVRKTKGNDYYLTLTESTKKMNGEGYERHKIFLYKEDFNRFLAHFQEAIDHVKNDLLPDYDYDEFNRYDEYEGDYNPEGSPADAPPRTPRSQDAAPEFSKASEPAELPESAESAEPTEEKDLDDMSW